MQAGWGWVREPWPLVQVHLQVHTTAQTWDYGSKNWYCSCKYASASCCICSVCLQLRRAEGFLTKSQPLQIDGQGEPCVFFL